MTTQTRDLALSIPLDAWRDVTADYETHDEVPPLPLRACLLATVWIGREGGPRAGFHVEAFRVTTDHHGDRTYHGISEDRLAALLTAWDTGGPELVTLDDCDRDYLVVISPFD